MSQELCKVCDNVFDPGGSQHWDAQYDPEVICGLCWPEQVKNCSTCGKDKHPTEFWRNASIKCGRTTQCADCLNKYYEEKKSTNAVNDELLRNWR